jgi:hypothetical protein
MILALRKTVRAFQLLLALIFFLFEYRLQAQEPDAAGLNALTEETADQVSQRDPNPLGEIALAIHPEQWKHAETEHFIYHYIHSYVATPVSVEAEFHYRVVVKELEKEPPSGDVKSHIYIFEGPEQWREFQNHGQLEPWSGGIHSAGSLFIVRNPSHRFSGNELGHEIVHLVMHRYYTGGIPSWLDEGLAQYVSKNAHASYERARGYLAKPHSEAIAPGDFIPVPKLIAMTQPPAGPVPLVHTFYDESERLVRFLAATDKGNFLQLVDALARHQPFETAFSRIFLGRFANTAIFEEKFKDYVARDFGSTIQQASEN